MLRVLSEVLVLRLLDVRDLGSEELEAVPVGFGKGAVALLVIQAAGLGFKAWCNGKRGGRGCQWAGQDARVECEG